MFMKTQSGRWGRRDLASGVVPRSTELAGTTSDWWARPSSVVVGLASAAGLMLVLVGWLFVVDDLTGDARSGCAQI